MSTRAVLLACVLAAAPHGSRPAGAQSDGQRAAITDDAVRVEARLVRDTFTLQSQPFPAWNVELTYVNQSRETVELGHTLLLMVPSAAPGTTVGTYVSRAPADPSRAVQRLGDRYAMNWGIDVPATGSGLWPFHALSSRLNQGNALIFSLMMESVPALPGGGYGPPVPPGETRRVTEKVFFPFDVEIKGEREVVAVVPPTAAAVGHATPAPVRVLVFDVKGVVEKGATFSTPREVVLPTGLEALRRDATDSGSPVWRRILAVNLLADAHPAESRDPLLAYAADHTIDPALRTSAILNLGLHKTPGTLDVLVRVLQSEPADTHRIAAIAALGDLGDAAAAPALRPLLKDTDTAVARFAIGALGSLKDGDSVPLLAAALADSRQNGLHAPASAALVAMDTDPARQAVLAGLRDRRLKAPAREALATAVSQARSNWAMPVIRALAADEHEEESVRLRAVWALSAVRDADAIAALRTAAASKKKRVREAAASGLEQIEKSRPAGQ